MKSMFLKTPILLFFVFMFFVAAPPTSAAGPWRYTDQTDCFSIADQEQKSLCLAGTFTAGIVSSQATLAEQLGGCIDGISRKNQGDCEKEAQAGGAASFLNQSSLAAKSDAVMIALYQNAPASTIEGVADLGRTFGLLPHQVYAQGPGIGFAGLAPLLPIWKAFRNIAYFLIAIIMVVVGFMVMFRKKIDPKTVVTVQNAIPGIIVTLLLITFSYAIVGVMIDLMYFSISLILTMLIPVGNSISPGVFDTNTYAKYLNAHWYNAVGMIFNAGLRTTDDIIGFVTPGGMFTSGVAGGLTAGTVALIPILGGAAAFLPTALVVGGVVAILPILIVLLAAIFAIFRILFMLLSSYINIIIALLTAPLQLLMGAIPGNTAFSSWFKNLISNLLPFPITAAFFLIATMLASYEQNPILGSSKLWSPPFIGGGTRGVTGVIALGILFAIPTIVNSLKESLKAKPPVAAGPGAVLGPIGSGLGSVMQFGYQAMFIKQALTERPRSDLSVDERLSKASKKAANEGPGTEPVK